ILKPGRALELAPRLKLPGSVGLRRTRELPRPLELPRILELRRVPELPGTRVSGAQSGPALLVRLAAVSRRVRVTRPPPRAPGGQHGGPGRFSGAGGGPRRI